MTPFVTIPLPAGYECVALGVTRFKEGDPVVGVSTTWHVPGGAPTYAHALVNWDACDKDRFWIETLAMVQKWVSNRGNPQPRASGKTAVTDRSGDKHVVLSTPTPPVLHGAKQLEDASYDLEPGIAPDPRRSS